MRQYQNYGNKGELIYKEFKQYFKRYPLAVKVYHSFRKWSLRVGYPFRLVTLELTNKCPMKCIMCVRTYKMNRKQGFMDINVFKKIIDEVCALDAPFIHEEGFWLHHFGESLLHPEFDKMIRYCSDRGVKAGLSLNPMVMEKEIARRLIDARPNLLFLALDGHDDESFYKIRGVPNAYGKSKENTLNFLKIKEEVGSEIKTVVSMIDFPENRVSIEKMRDYWQKQEGVDEVHLKPFTYWNDEIEKVKELACERRSTDDIGQVEKKKSRRVKCNTPWLLMSITWDGSVVPCCYDYDNKYVLGNVKNSSLREIWNGKKMRQLRKEFLTGNVKNPLCEKCPDLYE